MRVCFRIKVKFSDVLLVSHRIIQRQSLQNILLLLFVRLTRGDVAFKFSPLPLKLLSGCQDSGSHGTCAKLCNSFLSTWRWTDQPKPKTIISYSAIRTEKVLHFAHARIIWHSPNGYLISEFKLHKSKENCAVLTKQLAKPQMTLPLSKSL